MWFQRLRVEGAGSRSPLLRRLPYHHNSTAVDPKLLRTPKHKVKPQGYTDTYLPLDYREGITDSRLVRGLLWVAPPPPPTFRGRGAARFDHAWYRYNGAAELICFQLEKAAFTKSATFRCGSRNPIRAITARPSLFEASSTHIFMCPQHLHMEKYGLTVFH